MITPEPFGVMANILWTPEPFGVMANKSEEHTFWTTGFHLGIKIGVYFKGSMGQD